MAFETLWDKLSQGASQVAQSSPFWGGPISPPAASTSQPQTTPAATTMGPSLGPPPVATPRIMPLPGNQQPVAAPVTMGSSLGYSGPVNFEDIFKTQNYTTQQPVPQNPLQQLSRAGSQIAQAVPLGGGAMRPMPSQWGNYPPTSPFGQRMPAWGAQQGSQQQNLAALLSLLSGGNSYGNNPFGYYGGF